MKLISRLLLTTLILAGLLFTISCGGDDGPSASEVMLEKLMAHPWHTNTVLVDGTDKTSVYSGLSLTFTKSGYTATDITPSWPTSGTWEFTDDKAESIVRNDDLVIRIVSVTDNELKLAYTWNTTSIEPGRVRAVGGDHVLTLVKTL
jgi:hypothetical protein